MTKCAGLVFFKAEARVIQHFLFFTLGFAVAMPSPASNVAVITPENSNSQTKAEESNTQSENRPENLPENLQDKKSFVEPQLNSKNNSESELSKVLPKDLPNENTGWKLTKSASGSGIPEQAQVLLKSFEVPPYEKLLEVHFNNEKPLSASQKNMVNEKLRKLVLAFAGSQKDKSKIQKTCELKFPSKNSKVFSNLPPSLENLECEFLFLKREVAREKMLAIPVLKRLKSKNVRKIFPKTKKLWEKLADIRYGNALEAIQIPSLEDGKVVLSFVEQTSKDCRFLNASIAVLREFEEYLPSPIARENMEFVSKQIEPCFDKKHEAFEAIHLRLGLLELERGNYVSSAAHLENALIAEEQTEVSRSLFWRGYLHHLVSSSSPQKFSNPLWNKLYSDFPISFHTLVAAGMEGQKTTLDSLESQSSVAALYDGDTWTAQNRASFLGAILLASNQLKSLESWARFCEFNFPEISGDNALFFAKLFLFSGNTRQAIKTAFQYVKKHGSDGLTPEVVQLMYPVKFESILEKNAAKDVDVSLVLALIRQESSFNPNAKSPVGAHGLMQVMPGTAKRLNGGRTANLGNPAENIRLGSKYLSKMLSLHDENYVETIASYNAGPKAVEKWVKRFDKKSLLLFADLIPYPETRNYVSGLMRNMHWYKLVLLERGDEEKLKSTRPWTLESMFPPARPLLSNGEVVANFPKELEFLNVSILEEI